jgi:hypothetical protein
MNDSSDLEGGVALRYQFTIVHRQQISMMAESQKENAPPPGPSSGIHQIGNSVLFHIRQTDKTAISIAATISARLIPVNLF